MTNIVDLGGKPIETPEKTHDYLIVTIFDDHAVQAHGHLSFNPLFAAVVDDDNKLLVAVPMDKVKTISRM